MKRVSDKRPAKRSKRRTPGKARSRTRAAPVVRPAQCLECRRELVGDDHALFVEEEVGRVFCSEDCITHHFAGEIDLLEKEYFERRPKADLTPDQRESLSHLKWMTLQEPDEVWQERTENGDFRYTLISEFEPSPSERIWFVCICLFLRGQPSFLYLGFPTRSASMVAKYRRGQPVVLEPAEGDEAPSSDGLASGFTEDELMRADLLKRRRADDIPISDYSRYDSCFQETLEAPDEVLSMDSHVEEHLRKVFHFIKEYSEQRPRVWYVVIARETPNEDQLEVLDAFPTRDAKLIDHLKRKNGEATELAEAEMRNRVVH